MFLWKRKIKINFYNHFNFNTNRTIKGNRICKFEAERLSIYNGHVYLGLAVKTTKSNTCTDNTSNYDVFNDIYELTDLNL